MTDNIIEYFEKELNFLYQSCRSIAEKYPQGAKSLGLDRVSEDTRDPFYRNLLESVAYLSARVNRRIDESTTEFGKRLLDLVYPGYTAPVPSFTVVRFQPNLDVFAPDSSTEPAVIERGHLLASRSTDGDDVTFSTCLQVCLTPVTLAPKFTISAASDYRNHWTDVSNQATHALRLDFAVPDNFRFDMIKIDRIPIYIKGGKTALNHTVPSVLQALMLNTVSIRFLSDGSTLGDQEPTVALDQFGADHDQSLLSVEQGVYSSEQAIREYFMFPQRFHFVALSGLQSVFSLSRARHLSCVVFLDASGVNTSLSDIDQLFNSVEFHLYSTPASNLFPKSLDIFEADGRQHEHIVLPSRTDRKSYEIHSLRRVKGSTSHREIEFKPFYSTFSANPNAAFYSLRRESSSLVGESAAGDHEKYEPSEIFISFVDKDHSYLDIDTPVQLSVDALCTNRARLLDGSVDLEKSALEPIVDNGFVHSTYLLEKPSVPVSCWAIAEHTTNLVGLLSRNYRRFGMQNQDVEDSHKYLNNTLNLLALSSGRRQSAIRNSVLAIESKPVIKNIYFEGVSCISRGMEIRIKIDEDVFPGKAPYVFCLLLKDYVRSQGSINSSIDVVFCNRAGAEIVKWDSNR